MTLVKLDHYYPDFKDKGLANYDMTNYEVIARGDEKVGSVNSILLDDDTRKIRYLVVDTGFWFFGKKVLLPIALGFIAYMDRHVYVQGLTKEQVEALPEYSEDITINSEYEEKIRQVLRPLVEQVQQDQNYGENYNLDQEPYFYAVNDPNLKEVQEQLTASKKQRG